MIIRWHLQSVSSRSMIIPDFHFRRNLPCAMWFQIWESFGEWPTKCCIVLLEFPKKAHFCASPSRLSCVFPRRIGPTIRPGSEFEEKHTNKRDVGILPECVRVHLFNLSAKNFPAFGVCRLEIFSAKVGVQHFSEEAAMAQNNVLRWRVLDTAFTRNTSRWSKYKFYHIPAQ